MNQMSTEMGQHQPKRQHIAWRRERVAELSSQGRTEREIAGILKVAPATVGRDLSYLNKQAHDNLQFHIQEQLPAQYRQCQNGLSQVLKMAWNIVLVESPNQSNKLQALSLISDCYRHQMELATNGVVVTDAIKYVNGQMNHLNNQEKKLLLDIKDKGNAEAEAEDKQLSNNPESEEEKQTHNEIF